MSPLLDDGCIVIIKKAVFSGIEPREGDVIIFNSPLDGHLIIKKCSYIDETSVFVTGINLPESTDSRHFGRISKSDIKGSLWIKI